jgi:hypothetical protein
LINWWCHFQMLANWAAHRLRMCRMEIRIIYHLRVIIWMKFWSAVAFLFTFAAWCTHWQSDTRYHLLSLACSLPTHCIPLIHTWLYSVQKNHSLNICYVLGLGACECCTWQVTTLWIRGWLLCCIIKWTIMSNDEWNNFLYIIIYFMQNVISKNILIYI